MLACGQAPALAAQNPGEHAGELRLDTRVIGQKQWLCGAATALRVVVSDHMGGKPLKAHVAIRLQSTAAGEHRSMLLYSGDTNALGTLQGGFSAPNCAPGAYTLCVHVDSALGADDIREPVQLADSVQTLLAADKPLYQPGQIVHMRALAINAATRKPAADQQIVFEVADGRGNKVFKQNQRLSRFGVASADFQLADEVNEGVYTLRALLADGDVERKVRVERYVLPKYKLALTTDRPYYLPGERVSGNLHAAYFFGKPVALAAVHVSINTVDIGVTRLTDLRGATDATGDYSFSFSLPGSFVGQPFEQGKAAIGIKAEVADAAGQRQDANATVPVVAEPIQLTLIPEGGALVPRVANRVYIAASTPDDKPVADLHVTVSSDGTPSRSVVTTDQLGIAVYSFTPRQGAAALSATAAGGPGRTASASTRLSAAQGGDGIILRSDKTLARVGDVVALTALCSLRSGTMYLDVVRDGQTALTQAEALHDGRAEFRLPISADLTGTLQVAAYVILPSENIIRAARYLVASPAGELNVAISADRGEYRPGSDATLRFDVTDSSHRPVSAALGVAMVDESVFALSELQPGLERVYFTLERELMEPKYEIHGLSPTFLMEPGPRALSEQARQRAAAVLLAAAVPKPSFDLAIDTFDTKWQHAREQAIARMAREVREISEAIAAYELRTQTVVRSADDLNDLIVAGDLLASDILDPWRRPYRVDHYRGASLGAGFTLSSAGPDGRWNTSDDIVGVTAWSDWQALREARGGGFQFGEAGGPMMGRELAARGFMGGMAGLGGRPGVGGGAASGLLPAGIPPGDLYAYDADGSIITRYDQLAAKSSAQALAGGSPDPPRLRSYFPETMLWRPGVITDDTGRAEIKTPIADSITTWRVSAMANSADGLLGSAAAPVHVFQDFFADIDLPIALTQGDSVSVPVTLYNYLDRAQDVTVELKPAPWFRLEGAAERTLHMAAGQVAGLSYPITVTALGRFALSVTARGSRASDAVQRSVEVRPDGKAIEAVVNDRLDRTALASVTIPPESIAGASKLWVRLYPGAFSTVVDGLDGVLQMPNGCFEQTSSTTYPDVLILDYLKTTKRISPELQMRAEAYVNTGYQRLVTFECPGGGFSWFGAAPAHQVLTAYGLLEFADMARVWSVDPQLIRRTQDWLASRQRDDGSWLETESGIAEGIINRQSGALRTTAYVCWALAESGYQGAPVRAGVRYVTSHIDEARDPYTLAVILNMLATVDRGGEATANTARSLIAIATATEKAAYWQTTEPTFTGAEQEGADIEATGLATYALARWGGDGGFVTKALTYLVHARDPHGTWSTTQGTVWAMKALLYASRDAVGGASGAVAVLVNGHKAASWTLHPGDSDVVRAVDGSDLLHQGENSVELHYEGAGAPLYQVASRYYLPWRMVAPQPPKFEPLSLQVDYDKTTLAKDDTAAVTVRIRNTTDRIAEMPLIDLGVPPGFTVVEDALERAVSNRTIAKYTVAARQVIVYLSKLDPGQEVVLTYQVRARFPIRARIPASRAYPYYNPERVTVSKPIDIAVE